MMLFVGDDWAQDHHDVYLMDEQGVRLAARRLPEGLAGVGQLHDMIAAHAGEPDEVIVGIEKDHGLWVGALAAAGYRVYAINPMAVARYRDRHRVSGAKSDGADAKLLADLVRTDRHNHRRLVGDSDAAEAIKVLARTHQNLIWMRARQVATLRAGLLDVRGCWSITPRRCRRCPLWVIVIVIATRWRCWAVPRPPSKGRD